MYFLISSYSTDFNSLGGPSYNGTGEFCQAIKGEMVEVASATYADIIEEYFIEEKNSNK
tara:strand:+ start:126 stop:302 length:177 start_codon:yes stop_codon:yes gene_type:complete